MPATLPHVAAGRGGGPARPQPGSPPRRPGGIARPGPAGSRCRTGRGADAGTHRGGIRPAGACAAAPGHPVPAGLRAPLSGLIPSSPFVLCPARPAADSITGC